MPLQGHVDVISTSEIAGWAIDWDQPQAVLDISIIVNGTEVATCKTDIPRPGLKEALGCGASGIHEFKYVFVPPLDHRDHHHIEVSATQSKTVLPNGRRTLYRTNPSQSRLTPILLTSNGRSGTTMLMREFVFHPDIAVANAYPFEFKLTSYYAAAWHVLTQSTHSPTEDEVDFAARATRDLLIGRNPWNRPDLLSALGGPQAPGLFGRVIPDRLAQLFQSIVNENYLTIATANNKSPHFFAEKSALEEPVRHAARALFPDVREIVLIRDPRDYLCSAKTFWKHGVNEILATQAIELPILSNIFLEQRSDVLFVRYEDLVRDTVNTLRRIYDFIGCASVFAPHQINADVVPVGHRTSTSATDSIGRFHTELDAPLLAACNEKHAGFLDMFGYGR